MKSLKCMLFGLLFLTQANLFSQELIPYYDREKQKYGFQNKETRQIIIQPEFEDAVEWWRDYGIVRIDGKYGLIDREGKKASAFRHDYMFVEHCEECLTGELSAFHYYGLNYTKARKIYLNDKCECSPKPFYPCPPMVKTDTSQLSIGLKYIQRAEYYYHRGEIKKALDYADKAIASDSTDGSFWFWRASHMADAIDIFISEDPDELYQSLENDLSIWENAFMKAQNELENAAYSEKSKTPISEEEYNEQIKILYQQDSAERAIYARRQKSIDSINVFYIKWEEQGWDYWNTRFDNDYPLDSFYNGAIRHIDKKNNAYYSALAGKYDITYVSKSEKKKIKKEIRNGVPWSVRKSEQSLMIQPAYGIFPYQKAEINIMFGLSDFVFQNVFPVMASFGLGYEIGIERNLRTYKAMIATTPIGPLHGAVNFLYSTEGNQKGIGFRPEFGFTFSALTILYGYNFISNSKFPEAKGNIVAVRLNLPVYRWDRLAKHLGNNLYR
jgi:tetratricopeptide (TPR) repeat protein